MDGREHEGVSERGESGGEEESEKALPSVFSLSESCCTAAWAVVRRCLDSGPPLTAAARFTVRTAAEPLRRCEGEEGAGTVGDADMVTARREAHALTSP